MAGDTRWLAGLSLTEDQIASIALGRRQGGQGPARQALKKVVAASTCKAALHSETRGAAVDMESHIAAAYAAEAGIPFRGAAGNLRSRPSCVAGGCARGRSSRTAISTWSGYHGQRCGAITRSLRGPGLERGIDFNRALRSLRGCRERLSAGRRGPRRGECLKASSAPARRKCTAPVAALRDRSRRHLPLGPDAAQRHPHRLQRMGNRIHAPRSARSRNAPCSWRTSRTCRCR